MIEWAGSVVHLVWALGLGHKQQVPETNSSPVAGAHTAWAPVEALCFLVHVLLLAPAHATVLFLIHLSFDRCSGRSMEDVRFCILLESGFRKALTCRASQASETQEAEQRPQASAPRGASPAEPGVQAWYANTANSQQTHITG